MTHPHVSHDSVTPHITSRLSRCKIPLRQHDPFICVTWHIYTCMLHRQAWLIRMCNMAYSHVHVAHVSASCECDTLHVSTSCHTRSNDTLTCHIHMCNMTHSHVWHDASTCVTWHIHMCDMTHSHVWHDMCTCVTWRIHMCDMTHSHVWHNSFIRVPHIRLETIAQQETPQTTWLIHESNTTHSHVQHDLLTCAIWRIHMCNMTHSQVWHDTTQSYVYRIYTSKPSRSKIPQRPWLLHVCDMTHPQVWHDSFIPHIRLEAIAQQDTPAPTLSSSL